MVAVTGVHSHPPITQLLEQWLGVLFMLPNQPIVVQLLPLGHGHGDGQTDTRTRAPSSPHPQVTLPATLGCPSVQQWQRWIKDILFVLGGPNPQARDYYIHSISVPFTHARMGICSATPQARTPRGASWPGFHETRAQTTTHPQHTHYV
jgi:hypothetical protein